MMDFQAADRLSKALLYEAYALYPYRPSALKNRRRWSFGSLYPQAWANAMGGHEPCGACFQCLVEGPEEARLEGRLRFLQDGGERDVPLPPTPLAAGAAPSWADFSFAAGAEAAGPALRGTVQLSVERLASDLFRLTVEASNTSALGPIALDEAARHAVEGYALGSAHVLLGVSPGAFVSLLEPAEERRAAAEACRQAGLWPVLVGEAGRRDVLLASPIVLYDYPRVAAESPGDLFDGTEMDEILSLRVQAMTDAEKREAAEADPRVAALLQRTESLGPAEMSRLHGRWSPRAPRPGARVCLRPRHAADIFDIALAGRTALVESVVEDYEGRVLVAVTVDDDPGRDLGADGRPGHRFFFHLDEVEALPAAGPEGR
jgi:hypothetical protein